jgi:selenophosphate synthase
MSRRASRTLIVIQLCRSVHREIVRMEIGRLVEIAAGAADVLGVVGIADVAGDGMAGVVVEIVVGVGVAAGVGTRICHGLRGFSRD